MTLDDLPFGEPTTPANPAATPRRCYRHDWMAVDNQTRFVCLHCSKVRDETVRRRNRNNRKRGNGDELRVADLLGGRKVGQLGLPWDVELPGYLRVQAKKLDRWPSLAKVIEWLDAIPMEPELRAVTLADTPGHGGKTRRLIVLDLDEFAVWHGRKRG